MSIALLLLVLWLVFVYGVYRVAKAVRWLSESVNGLVDVVEELARVDSTTWTDYPVSIEDFAADPDAVQKLRSRLASRAVRRASR